MKDFKAAATNALELFTAQLPEEHHGDNPQYQVERLLLGLLQLADEEGWHLDLIIATQEAQRDFNFKR